MKKGFYFTYGTDGTQPFRGGWTVVCANSFAQAVALFQTVHPCREPGVLDCEEFYTDIIFKKHGLHKKGNYGAYCQEIIGAFRTDKYKIKKKGRKERRGNED